MSRDIVQIMIYKYYDEEKSAHFNKKVMYCNIRPVTNMDGFKKSSFLCDCQIFIILIVIQSVSVYNTLIVALSFTLCLKLEPSQLPKWK